jgi:signal transduction histidine kinase
MRLVIILLLLVVLPTGILSVLAGRSIQAREAILYRRLEQDAMQQIDGVREAFRGILQADADQVQNLFRNTVLAGTDAEGIARAVSALRERCLFVSDIYLFMNPWGFVYPRSPASEAENPLSESALLRQDLIEWRSLAGRPSDSSVSLHRDGRTFCFSSLSDFSELHSGFELDVDAAFDQLESIVADYATPDIGLRVSVTEGRARLGTAPHDDVYVSDSFSSEADRPSRLGAKSRGMSGVLASGALPDPFSDVRVIAFLVREDDIKHAEFLEARLIGWGILLLAVVITASSTILIRKTITQSAQARQRSEFVIGMSHDLRTPVASMRILADSLCAGRVKDPEKQQHFLRTISNECERLGDKIERILFFLRQDQRAMSYTMSPFAVGELVSHAVTTYRDRLQGRISIVLTLDDAPTMVDGDAEALVKVVNNLLDNAVKYGVLRDTGLNASGEVGGLPPPPDIEVGVCTEQRRGRDWIVIRVADHGPGIPTQVHDKVFERFYRHERDVHRHVGGIGLGLSLCMDIVKAHRGRIRLDSEPGAGAVFSVWLRSESKI